jgi:hypothetical protein
LKNAEHETGRTSQANDERVLKAGGDKLSARQRESSCAGQSKSQRFRRRTVQDDPRAPTLFRQRMQHPAIDETASGQPGGPSLTPAGGDDDMRTSLPRSLVLGGAIATSLCIGYALGAQPHMDETIAILQSARVELGKAEPNKGGHREKAIGLIDQAIAEVRAGIAFAAGH